MSFCSAAKEPECQQLWVYMLEKMLLIIAFYKKKKKTHIFRYSEQWNEHVHMYMIVHKHPDYFVEKAVSL